MFSNKDDKNDAMCNLRKLKAIEDFKGISVTEDYTIPERQLIKESRRIAKEKNMLKGNSKCLESTWNPTKETTYKALQKSPRN